MVTNLLDFCESYLLLGILLTVNCVVVIVTLSGNYSYLAYITLLFHSLPLTTAYFPACQNLNYI